MNYNGNDSGGRPEPRLSRRGLFTAIGAVGLSAGAAGGAWYLLSGENPASSPDPAPPPPRDPSQPRDPPPRPVVCAEGALGANFNGAAENVDFRELEATSAGWLRGFFAMSDAAQADLSRQSTIKTILDAEKRGYGTILSLKFQYDDRPIPVPGSAAMTTELARLDKVLPLLMGRVDKLLIGNEPFIESREEDRTGQAMNACYEEVAHYVISHQRRHCGSGCKTKLYMGAMNQLDVPGRRTTATERWLTFTRETEALAGVDIHPHVRSPEATDDFLEYVLPKLRADQTFLVTEFSMVAHWRDHLRDSIPAAFAEEYGFPKNTQVWEVIRAAIENPVPQQQWNDFLSAAAWFENRKHFLRDQMKRFRETGKLGVATYGLWQDEPMTRDFGPDKSPWILNSVFAPYTVRPRPDGTSGRGYNWIDDFRALQAGCGTYGAGHSQ